MSEPFFFLGIVIGLALVFGAQEIWRRLTTKRYEILRPTAYYAPRWPDLPPTTAKKVPEEEKEPPNNT